ncbi:hypothetical protein DRJ25_04190 [Candidatus Woesearchaeota archaeon]|nr:MAG: hypothetical protein DRJ25_04190 [Candidatus Woesearchaeota archaeon]
MTENNEIKTIIPDWLHIQIKDWNELKGLGKGNIKQLIKYQNNSIDTIKKTIEELNEYAGILKGKSGKDIAEEAKKYENPIFSPEDLTIRADEGIKSPEPIKDEDKKRQKGETTFNKCGWCKYAGTGLHRYNYMIKGECRLLYLAGQEETDRGITTDCSLKKMSGENIENIVNTYNSKIEDLEREIEKRQSLIERLETISQTTEEKPYLPQLRPMNLFREGSEVIVYLGDIDDVEVIVDEQFIEGKIVSNEEWFVLFESDERWHKGDYQEGRGGLSGLLRPDILSKKEFEYLTQNPDFLDLWLKQIPNEEHYEGFKQAIRKATEK